MDQVFTHSQTWVGKDKKLAFIRFKMHPWFKELEEAFVQFLKRGGQAIIKGQSAPRGYKVVELGEIVEPIKGKGKGERQQIVMSFTKDKEGEERGERGGGRWVVALPAKLDTLPSIYIVCHQPGQAT